MPAALLTHRPQTLKQAKKAYRKSAGTVCLSESEKAIIERRVLLQERADRINEREARRKANLKRKEERVQREREARHRMGIATPPAKEGIHVGPSQLHLSGFLYAGVKRKTEEGEEAEDRAQRQEKLVKQEHQYRPAEPLLSANPRPQWMMPSQIANANSPKARDFALQDSYTPPKPTSPARCPLQAKSMNPVLHKSMDGLQPKASDLPKPQDRPSPRPLAQIANTDLPIFKKPPLMPPPLKPESLPEDYLDDFFVSNTQIQRELSPPPTPPAKPTPHTVPIIHPPTIPPPATEDPATLLTLLSTQDLDFTDEPTPAHLNKPSFSAQESAEEEEEEDFPDHELEDIVLEFSLESPFQSPNPNPNNPKTRAAPPSPPTHHSQEAQRAAEWDMFTLSTQDLLELAS